MCFLLLSLHFCLLLVVYLCLQLRIENKKYLFLGTCARLKILSLTQPRIRLRDFPYLITIACSNHATLQ